MRFKFLVDTFSVLHGYTGNGGRDSWEEEETLGSETPHEAAARIVSSYNRSLGSGEEPRKLVAVYEEEKKESPLEDIGGKFVEASNLLFELNEASANGYSISFGGDGWSLRLNSYEVFAVLGLDELIEKLQELIEDANT